MHMAFLIWVSLFRGLPKKKGCQNVIAKSSEKCCSAIFEMYISHKKPVAQAVYGIGLLCRENAQSVLEMPVLCTDISGLCSDSLWKVCEYREGILMHPLNQTLQTWLYTTSLSFRS